MSDIDAGIRSARIMKRLMGLLFAAIAEVGFASTFIFGFALTKECGVSPEVLSFLRFAIAGTLMLAVTGMTAKGRAKLSAPTRADWVKMSWLGPVGTSVMAWCVFMGCARVSAANASMADALTPLTIFAVATVMTRKVDAKGLAGLFCGLIGALLVMQIVDGDGIELSAYSVGDVFIFLAAATWGVYTVYGHEQINRLGSSVFTIWTMLIGAAAIGLILLAATFLSSTFNLQPSTSFVWPNTAKAWLLVSGLGIVSTLMPFWTWNAAQKYLPMSVLGISAYFTPVITVALAIVFLDEPATLLQWLGTIFIVASALVENRRKISKCK